MPLRVEELLMTDLVKRYIRVLRCAWLNPTSAEFQAAIHAFERTHPELVVRVGSNDPLLEGEELREALSNLDYFVTASPRWERHTRTDVEARQLLGGRDGS